MTAIELQVLAGLLLRLGLETAEVIALFRQKGVTEDQIDEADVENEIDVYDRIRKFQGGASDDGHTAG